jgi:hypothetical protein
MMSVSYGQLITLYSLAILARSEIPLVLMRSGPQWGGREVHVPLYLCTAAPCCSAQQHKQFLATSWVLKCGVQMQMLCDQWQGSFSSTSDGATYVRTGAI